jgi:hypothetical protein
MVPNASQLQNFYGTPLGLGVASILNGFLKKNPCPTSSAPGALLGFYPFCLEKEILPPSFFHLAPSHLGVVTHPSKEGIKSALVDEAALPLPDRCLAHVTLFHGLEFSREPDLLLQEVFRVLQGEGTLTVIVPHRRGLWSQFDSTPFGYGHPYTKTQIVNLLAHHKFEVEDVKRLLFIPPINSPWVVKLARPIEVLGNLMLRKFSGLLVAKARKITLGGLLAGETAKQRGRIKVPAVPDPLGTSFD